MNDVAKARFRLGLMRWWLEKTPAPPGALLEPGVHQDVKILDLELRRLEELVRHLPKTCRQVKSTPSLRPVLVTQRTPLTNPLRCSRKEAARILDISVRTLDYHRANKRIAWQKDGQKVVILYSELVRFSRSNHFGPVSGEPPDKG
jgi:hypothetical protein